MLSTLSTSMFEEFFVARVLFIRIYSKKGGPRARARLLSCQPHACRKLGRVQLQPLQEVHPPGQRVLQLGVEVGRVDGRELLQEVHPVRAQHLELPEQVVDPVAQVELGLLEERDFLLS